MHDLLDDYAHDNALRDISPKIKLLLGLGCVLLCVFSVSPVAPLIVAIIMSLAIVRMARIPAGFYLKLLLIPLSFAFMSSVAVLFISGSGDRIFDFRIFWLTLAISKDGINLALLLISRTIGGTSSLFFIALTTPMVEIFSTLKSMRLPDVFIELSMLIYRYIFVLMDQAARINNAQTLRLGHCGLKASLKSFSMLSSVLFLRAWEQGERFMIAMDSRCYNGRLETMERDVPVSPQATLAVVLFQIAIATVAILTREIKLI